MDAGVYVSQQTLLKDDIINSQPVSNGSSQRALPQMLQGPLIGLELLLDTTRIRLRQRIQMVKIYCGCDMPMNFELINERNQIIYQSEEHNGCCIRNCVPQGMRTESILSTMINAPVLRFQRESRCVLNCCLPCCCCALPFSKEQLSVVSIAGGGSVLGTIRHDWSMWTSKFSVLNGTGEVMAKIEGPGKGNFTCGGDIEFQMLAPNGYKLGSITKHYGGLVGELCTDFDEFTINFPLDLDVPLKACLVGAAHLITIFLNLNYVRIEIDSSVPCSTFVQQIPRLTLKSGVEKGSNAPTTASGFGMKLPAC
ncbi:conserved hypothetical protein [Culex quinquefasciatus]|uniref:Phospholipid scramblase n=1 Tax=Culex quinquefasciatus TaxID=7176 RepID=B0WES5_CULQU|nr:conserved hypothetical protein [Culex quinquefasciatus]|eukprot:XP_001847209.1 conserved hypothetical protein [Culex quinquefasciatus]